ncbi:MAG TPA: SagB/ThcOx family dehydrogenase [Anaerolineaceae bacterium]|nr:SagB/ThcOx family dehydrogenase [Anaerolineaceae bacterium]
MTDGIGKEFLEKTKYKYLSESLQRQGVPIPPLELPYDPTAELISLPDPETMPAYPMDLRKAIDQRCTLRRYEETSLTQDELSFLLWTTQGVKSVTNRPVTFRTVPSAGARHAFETYLVINKVDGIKPGLYRYISLEHALLPIEVNGTVSERIAEACLQQNQISNSAVSFIWVVVTERMYWRYGERGYRYLHLDAGHVCQNLYLAAEAIDSGVCAIAAFDDDALNNELNLDGENLWAIYVGALGKR